MTVSIRDIQRATSYYFDLPIEELTGPRKHREVNIPRQVAYTAAKQLTSQPLTEIGRQFGGRDHSTVFKGLRSLRERASAADEDALRAVRRISAKYASQRESGSHVAVKFMPIATHTFTVRQ